MIETAISTFFALLGGGGSAAALELLKGLVINSVNKGLQAVKDDSLSIAEQLAKNPQNEQVKQQLQPKLEQLLQAYPEFGQQIQELHHTTTRQTYIKEVKSKHGAAIGVMSGGTININNK